MWHYVNAILSRNINHGFNWKMLQLRRKLEDWKPCAQYFVCPASYVTGTKSALLNSQHSQVQSPDSIRSISALLLNLNLLKLFIDCMCVHIWMRRWLSASSSWHWDSWCRCRNCSRYCNKCALKSFNLWSQ
jgi:hypothetical protein